MLTQDNLADLLNALGFEKKGAIHRKLFGAAARKQAILQKYL